MDIMTDVLARKAIRFRLGIAGLEHRARAKRRGPFRSRLRTSSGAGTASNEAVFNAVRNEFGYPMLPGASREPADRVCGDGDDEVVVGGDGFEPPTSTV